MLVLRVKSTCPESVSVVDGSKAQDTGAAAVLMEGAPGKDVELITCKGPECDLPLTIFATMVPHAAAAQLQVCF